MQKNLPFMHSLLAAGGYAPTQLESKLEGDKKPRSRICGGE